MSSQKADPKQEVAHSTISLAPFKMKLSLPMDRTSASQYLGTTGKYLGLVVPVTVSDNHFTSSCIYLEKTFL